MDIRDLASPVAVAFVLNPVFSVDQDARGGGQSPRVCPSFSIVPCSFSCGNGGPSPVEKVLEREKITGRNTSWLSL